MDNKKNNIVDDHRNMLMISKNLSDFQIKNLQSWSFLFFEGIDSVEISYNFLDNKGDFNAGKITFDIQTKKEINKEEKEKGKEFLTASTKFMFWSDTKVIIKKNGKLWK
jgi:hypothetical protein